MNRFVLPSTVLFFLALLAGCFGGPLSEGEAESILQKLISERSEGAIRLVELKRTGSQRGEFYNYKMSVKGRIEIQEDCIWVPPDASSPVVRLPAFSVCDGTGVKYPGCERGTRGERRSFTGFLTFEETESGWNLSRANLQVKGTG